ncbi:MAG: TetR/AcrR family transcriptional regulator [Anaerolineales bacterium]|nr:TetR/AcrR family transcriptional regulator [Anaerolineales bacterium]
MPTETFFNLPADKRDRILDLAIKEFAENDYPQASVSRLVERAGIAKGSFYQYFGSKRALFEYLLELAAQEKARFLREALEVEEFGTVFDRLRRMMRQGLEFEFAHPELAQVGYRAYYAESPLPEQALASVRRAGQDFFRQLIKRGQERGEIDPDLDPALLAWLYSTVFENLGDFLLDRTDIDPADVKRHGAAALDQAGVESLMKQVVNLLERGSSPDGAGDAD